MNQELYFIGLSVQEIHDCRILKEKKPGSRLGDGALALKLSPPIPAKMYGSYRKKNISQIIFTPHVLKGQRHIYGTVFCPHDEFKGQLNFDKPYIGTHSVEDRGLLCLSKEEAKKQIQNLEDFKKRTHVLIFREKYRTCKIIKQFSIHNHKNYYIAEFDPPCTGKPYNNKKKISKIVLEINEFPGDSGYADPDIGAEAFFFDESVPFGDSTDPMTINLQGVDMGACIGPPGSASRREQQRRRRLRGS